MQHCPDLDITVVDDQDEDKDKGTEQQQQQQQRDIIHQISARAAAVALENARRSLQSQQREQLRVWQERRIMAAAAAAQQQQQQSQKQQPGDEEEPPPKDVPELTQRQIQKVMPMRKADLGSGNSNGSVSVAPPGAPAWAVAAHRRKMLLQQQQQQQQPGHHHPRPPSEDGGSGPKADIVQQVSSKSFLKTPLLINYLTYIFISPFPVISFQDKLAATYPRSSSSYLRFVRRSAPSAAAPAAPAAPAAADSNEPATSDAAASKEDEKGDKDKDDKNEEEEEEEVFAGHISSAVREAALSTMRSFR